MAIRFTDSSISAAQSAANSGLSELSPKRLPSDHTIVSGDEVWLKGGGPDYVMPDTAIPCQWSSILNGTLQGWPGTPKPVIRQPSAGSTATQGRVFALGSGGNWTVRNLIFRDCVAACYNMNTGSGTGVLRNEGVEVYNCGTLLYPGGLYLTNVAAGGNSALAEFYLIGCIFNGAGSDQVWARASNVIEVAYNEFYNSSMFDINGDNVQVLDSCANLWVHHNYFDHRNKDSKQCFIQSGTTGGVTTFEDNTVEGWQGEVTVNHNAVYSDQILIARRNRVASASSAFYYGSAGSRITGNVIRCGGGRLNTGMIWGATVADVQVTNNTIIKDIPGADVGEAAIRSTTSNANIITRNNIVAGFRRGIRRGALSVESFNCIFGAEIPVVDSAGTGSLSQVSPINVDPSLYLNSDYSLAIPEGAAMGALSYLNPLANAGTFVDGVVLMNGRMRPGLVPVGAFNPVLPRAYRSLR